MKLNNISHSYDINKPRPKRGKVKHELRVQIYELRVQTYELRVQIHKL